MRVSGWALGTVGFIGLILVTALCSIVAYTSTRQVVIDLWDSGIEVGSPGDMIQAITGNTEPFERPEATATQFIVVIGATDAPGEPTPQILPTETPAVQGEVVVDDTSPTPEPTKQVLFGQEAQDDPNSSADDVEPVAPAPDVSQLEIWDDPRQIRILLMGIDQRDAQFEQETVFRTDTMILANINPVTKVVGMISFPRDLWVDIPNYGQGRVNTANAIGDTNGYPGGGGPALAMETLAANFGVRVDYYVQINFDVFTTVANILAPNGVEICVEEYINDPDYPDAGYGTIEVVFQEGCQRLDAERLLQYARTRATQGGDFDRARRQQQVLKAMQDELLSFEGIANLITQAPNLWTELSDSFRTNLEFERVTQLAGLMTQISSDNIRSGVIDSNYTRPGTTPTGDQILVPFQSSITDLIERVFYAEANVDIATLKARAEEENASIVVYNGTDTSGLAGQTREWLASRGVVVSGVGNDSSHGGKNTIIRDYTGNRQTALYLAELLGIPQDRIQPGNDGLTTEDVMVVVGPDVVPILSGQ